MPNFAFVKNGTVRFVEFINPTSPAMEKWVALFRSQVLLKETTGYDVMPGDLFLDGKFYKKDLEDGSTTLLQEGAWTHPTAIRFAGIMDGEIVGQYGKDKSIFKNQQEIDDFIDAIISSDIIELTPEQSSFVDIGWSYDGTNFTNPNS